MKRYFIILVAVVIVFGMVFYKPIEENFYGLDGHMYTKIIERRIFSHDLVYFKDYEGKIVEDQLATAINNHRCCSCCSEYITKNYIKFGNDYYCSDECYDKFIAAVKRITEQ